MKRVVQHGLAGLALVSGGLMFTVACQHNDSSLFVQSVLAPAPVATGQECMVTNNPDQTVITSGILDVGLRDSYQATYLIGNQLVAQTNSQDLKTETSVVNIEGAIVTVTDAAGNQLDYYKSLTGTTVYPSTGSTPGYSFATVVAVSQAAIDTLVAQNGKTLNGGGSVTAVSYVKFYGHTLGGTYIESNNFEFPVEVCKTTLTGPPNCLVNFSGAAECNGAAIVGNVCLASSTASSLPVPCVIGQDTPIDCSVCQEYAVCQGVALPSACVADSGTD